MEGVKYQTDYQNYYFDDKTYLGQCKDCIKCSIVTATPACPDYHTVGNLCCSKYVCADGCTYYCGDCGTPNRVRLNDGYMLGFRCYKCKSTIEIPTTWWGNSIMIDCERYCGCPLNDWDGFVDGIESLEDDPITLKTSMLGELQEKIKTGNFGLQHVSRSCTLVIEEGSLAPIYIEYFDGRKAKRVYFYSFELDPTRYTPSGYL